MKINTNEHGDSPQDLTVLPSMSKSLATAVVGSGGSGIGGSHIGGGSGGGRRCHLDARAKEQGGEAASSSGGGGGGGGGQRLRPAAQVKTSVASL